MIDEYNSLKYSPSAHMTSGKLSLSECNKHCLMQYLFKQTCYIFFTEQLRLYFQQYKTPGASADFIRFRGYLASLETMLL